MLAFLGRLLRHVPDKGFKMVRHSGLFAPRWKARYLEQPRRALGQNPAPEPEGKVSENPVSLQSWPQRQLAQGRDPLRCPECDQPMLFCGVVFGPHERVEYYFDLADRPHRPEHPIAAQPP